MGIFVISDRSKWVVELLKGGKNYRRWMRNTLNGIYWRYFAKVSSTHTPVVVYQMGKVASSSIYFSLKSMKQFQVFHCHRLNPTNNAIVRDEISRSRKVAISNDAAWMFVSRKFFQTGTDEVSIISLVREPVGRNISAFFQNLYFFDALDHIYDSGALLRLFLERYPHAVPLEWFDSEVYEMTGIDVYSHDFPIDVGHQTIVSGRFRLLIMRHDLHDTEKERCVADFLSLDSFKLTTKNVGADKVYSRAYHDFLATCSLPDAYVRDMLSSKYAKHFFSGDELGAIYSKWTRAAVG